ncbi:NERD domain-containing protein, partial [Planctomycetota bacterium]
MTDAVNNSEQFVYEVCQTTFLSLWSYVNPQGRAPGKELCDILIVCDSNIIVISVKDVRLGDS